MVLVTAAKGGMSRRLRGILQLFHSMKLLTSGRYRNKEQWIRNTSTWRPVPLCPHHLLTSTPSSDRWFGLPLPRHHHFIHCQRHPILPRISQTRRGRCHPGSLPKALLPRSIRAETCMMMAPSIEAHISLRREMRRAGGTLFC